MDRLLSILIPSVRPNELDAFIASLQSTADDWNSIEVVILIDDTKRHVEYHGNIVIIHNLKQEILNISELHYECYKISSGKWIMLGNDDVLMKTKGWDTIIKSHMTNEHVLIYPNDNMFGESLACFPIISRKVIEAVGLFPMPYRRYKVDDTIFNLYPPENRIYLENVHLVHLNDKGATGEGYQLTDGRVYPIDRAAADYDAKLWYMELQRRVKMGGVLEDLIGSRKSSRVLIGVSTGEYARRADFYDYLNLLVRPEGTAYTSPHGQSPARSRNLIIEQALEGNYSHVLFLDDDLEFKPELLVNLLRHDKDVVTALYPMRNYPHQPIIFDTVDPKDQSCGFHTLHDHEKGLIPIVNAGLGAVLIKTEVFKALTPPYVTLGQLTKDMWCDDIEFFHRVRAAGFHLYCDLEQCVGHMASVTVWPDRINGKWHISYDTKGTGRVSFPLPRPTEVKV